MSRRGQQPQPVQAFSALRSNAILIGNCRRLGYLREDDCVFDATYGRGTFWRLWRPQALITNDADPGLGTFRHADFRHMPEWSHRAFDVVVFDPPYKLNGTPSGPMDLRYGVGQPVRWQDRMQQCIDGITECSRITKRVLLVKCMDQVVSGQVRWQSRLFADQGEHCGLRLTDMLLMQSGRPQPLGRRQVHARRNYSTMLVFTR